MRAIFWAVAAVLFATPMHADCTSIVVEMGSTKPVCTFEYPELYVRTTEPVREIHWRFGAGYAYMENFKMANLHNLTPRPMFSGGRGYSADIQFENGCQRWVSIDIENITEMRAYLPDPIPASMCDGSEFWLSPEVRLYETNIYDRGDPFPNPYHGPLEWSATNATILSGQNSASAQFIAVNDTDTPIEMAATWKLDITRHCVSGNVARATILPRPRVRTIATTANTCANQPQQASVEALPGDTYEWSIDNGSITSDPSASAITYVATGTSEARLRVRTNRGACGRQAETTLVIASGSSATVTSTTHTTCAGTSIDIPVALSGTAPFTLQWSDGFAETVGTTTHTRTVTPQASERYAITEVRATGGNCAGTAAGTVDVQISTRPEIVDEPKNVTIRRGETATLSVGGVGDGITFQWYEGASGDTAHPVASGTTRILNVTPQQTTRYWANVGSGCGAVFSKAATVAVNSEPARRRAAR
jgi:hypothetical protein